MPPEEEKEPTIAQLIIQDLLAKNKSKYWISKKLGVNWKTIHFWQKGFSKPSGKNEQKLSDLNNETEFL